MKSGLLKVTATDGAEVEVVWPPCGEEVLGHAVDFRIGNKLTTIVIKDLSGRIGLFGEGLVLFDGHRLSRKTAHQVIEWLKSAEISDKAVKFP